MPFAKIPFPTKTYQIIYADPPWEVNAGPGLGTGSGFPKVSNKRSRPLTYPTMTVEEIKALPVRDIADTDCHLYLWAINKYIREAYDAVAGWGFKPSCLLTWCKTPMGLGLGGAFCQTTEHLLFCRRGKLKTQCRINSSWFHHKRLSHSTKPAIFRDMIVSVSGDLCRIELFARTQTSGWEAWGNELDQKTNALTL